MQARTNTPTVSDFKHDMNDHNARHARVREDGNVFVLELERHRPRINHDGSFTLTVWQAVEHPDEPDKWAPADAPDNRYAWDAAGREEYRDADDETGDAQAAYRRLKEEAVAVREWCDEHPYDGPRSTWKIRRGYDN